VVTPQKQEALDRVIERLYYTDRKSTAEISRLLQISESDAWNSLGRRDVQRNKIGARLRRAVSQNFWRQRD
jgi:hypothetical protein